MWTLLLTIPRWPRALRAALASRAATAIETAGRLWNEAASPLHAKFRSLDSELRQANRPGERPVAAPKMPAAASTVLRRKSASASTVLLDVAIIAPLSDARTRVFGGDVSSLSTSMRPTRYAWSISRLNGLFEDACASSDAFGTSPLDGGSPESIPWRRFRSSVSMRIRSNPSLSRSCSRMRARSLMDAIAAFVGVGTGATAEAADSTTAAADGLGLL